MRYHVASPVLSASLPRLDDLLAAIGISHDGPHIGETTLAVRPDLDPARVRRSRLLRVHCAVGVSPVAPTMLHDRAYGHGIVRTGGLLPRVAGFAA